MSSCSDRPSITSPSIHFSGYSSEYSQFIFVASRIFSNPVKERKSECDEHRSQHARDTQQCGRHRDSTVLRTKFGCEPVNFLSFAIASKLLKSSFLNSLELRDAIQSDPCAAQRSTQ